jgi:hypothetical protein
MRYHYDPASGVLLVTLGKAPGAPALGLLASSPDFVHPPISGTGAAIRSHPSSTITPEARALDCVRNRKDLLHENPHL